MNLVGKILATAGLFCFLNLSNSQKIFAEEKESEKYETIFLCNYGQEVSLGWSTNHDGKEDLVGLYLISPTAMEDVFDLNLIGTKKDTNNTNKNEINDMKYSKFFLGVAKGDIILGWYGTDNRLNKLYYYKFIRFDEDKKGVHELEAIQEDTNKDHEFEDYEFMYQTEEFKSNFSKK